MPSTWFTPAIWFDYFARKNAFHERSLLPSQAFLSCVNQLTAAGLPLVGFKLPEKSGEIFNTSAPASTFTLPKCSEKVIRDSVDINKWAIRNHVISTSYTPSRLISPPYCEMLTAGIPAHDHRLADYKAYSSLECDKLKASLIPLASYALARDGVLGSRRFSEICAFASLLALGVAMGPGMIEELTVQAGKTLNQFKNKWSAYLDRNRQVVAIEMTGTPAAV